MSYRTTPLRFGALGWFSIALFAAVFLPMAAVRAPAESSARPVGPERLEELAGFFTPRAEIIASFSRPGDPGPASARRADVLAMLRRRPCTLEDVSAGLGIGGEEAAGLLDALAADGQAASSQRGGRIYWSA